MPTSQNWTQFIYINLAFIIQIALIYYFMSIVEIRANWQKYRCNPWYMPLSNNISQDFTYCVQTTQINLMGYLLQPLTYLMSNIILIGNKFAQNINSSRGMLALLRQFIENIAKSIFNTLLNFTIEIQRITIGIKDMIGKIVGIATTIIYILNGTQKTATSALIGSNGQNLRTFGSCFHPETKIRLKNGQVMEMQHLPLGSILENDSRVLAAMKIERTEPLYKILQGVNNEHIYVTGSHYIYDPAQNKFIRVKEYILAYEQKEVKSNWYSCLITSNGRIPIGKQLFWDWEDDLLDNYKI